MERVYQKSIIRAVILNWHLRNFLNGPEYTYKEM